MVVKEKMFENTMSLLQKASPRIRLLLGTLFLDPLQAIAKTINQWINDIDPERGIYYETKALNEFLKETLEPKTVPIATQQWLCGLMDLGGEIDIDGNIK